ncbi:MAG: DoxX family membrane protein [Candidatus Latescibacterota bacterium]|nr:MAG: DoxX family membrane protein [Candidatus Latescibacterota bacterium]
MSDNVTTVQSTNPLTVLLTNKAFILLLRVLLGALFVFSSADKVLHPDRFAVAIRAYEILPIALTNIFALVVAWAELVAGVMLVFGVLSRKAASAILILLVVFTVAIAATMIRGLVIDCGCFSNEGGSQTGAKLILRNLFLIVISLMIIRFDGGYLGLSRYLEGRKRAR